MIEERLLKKFKTLRLQPTRILGQSLACWDQWSSEGSLLKAPCSHKAPLQLSENTPWQDPYCPSIIQRRVPNATCPNIELDLSEVTKTDGNFSKGTSRGGKIEDHRTDFTASLRRSQQSLYETSNQRHFRDCQTREYRCRILFNC